MGWKLILQEKLVEKEKALSDQGFFVKHNFKYKIVRDKILLIGIY